MEGRDLLFKLCDSTGVSGSEYKIHHILEEYFKETCSDIFRGRLGDFIAMKKGSGNLRVMISAHMDEIGLMVKSIDERGFIHFVKVGGVDSKTLPAQEVIIHGRKDVYGVIGAKPPHVLSEEERKKAVSMENMLIDTGMNRKQILELVSIGDLITIKRECTGLLNDYMTGKAMDNRAGICAMYECSKLLVTMDHKADVYFTASTMEELGCLGVRTDVHNINPDIGIALDVTFGDKYADEGLKGECGSGVEIAIGPNIHQGLAEKLIKVADENNIPYFIEVYPGNTGTDAWEMQVAGEGVPTILVSIPIRYMHSSIEVVKYSDIKTVGELMALFISALEDWSDGYDS